MNKWIVLPAYQKNGGESNIFPVGERNEGGKSYESYSIKADVNGLENARLVAAAPELLDALQVARDMIIVSFGGIVDAWKDEHLRKIEDAISKVEG